MKTGIGISLVVLVLGSVEIARTQNPDSVQSGGNVIQKMYTGAAHCLAWYDIPIAAADLAELAFVPANATGKPVKFSPTSFDSRFESHVAVQGSQTVIGRAGDAGVVAFLGLRLLVNVGSDLAGGNVTSEDYQRTFWFYKSIVYTYSVTALTKSMIYRLRPDRSDGESFFSGHSSTAFCVASYCSLELDDWFDRWENTRRDDNLRLMLKIGSTTALYAGATYVAYSRLHDQKHYFTDVAVGAVVGTVVGTVMHHWHSNGASSPDQDVSFAVVNKTPFFSYTLRF
jgi:membrane-associated phospholipid phosphatase